jgi:hypothetical protein
MKETMLTPASVLSLFFLPRAFPFFFLSTSLKVTNFIEIR